MTDAELLHIRMLIAEAGRASAVKMRDFMADYADIMAAIAEEYRQFVPEGHELPASITDMIEALREKVDP